jgi:ribose transport system ATP-binding protein
LAEAAVRLRGVSKRFGATVAVADVGLEILAGETHALVGQNGAGKSTLGRIIGGIVARDSGEVWAFGIPVTHWSPKLALQHGIAMIQQELSLVPELSVAENIFLGIESTRLGLLRGDLIERFEELNAHAGFNLDPRARLGSLRIADRQKVEILRALARDARLIVMDEPTSALTMNEANQLHDIVRWLRDGGRTVVYVSHFLDDVLKHTDRVTVLRDGRIVRTSPTSEETSEKLVSAMLGRTMELTFPDRPAALQEQPSPLLRVEHLAAPPAVVDVSFEVGPGEIVGLAGLVGSGRSETLRAVFGRDPSTGGRVEIEGRPYEDRSPLASIRRGLGMIPEDRRDQGLIATMSVRGNVTLASIRDFAMAGLIQRGREASAVGRLLTELDVTPPRVDGSVATLSGGNQQKILFAKWLSASPRIFLLDEPTRGVDVGAKRRIYRLITELGSEGLGVVLVSSELEEVMSLSHRVYLIHAGRTFDVVDPREISLDEVVFRLFGLSGEAVPA